MTLAPGDFAAVDDLVSDLAERHVHGEAIEVAGSVDVGHYLVDVVAVRSVVAMLTRTPSIRHYRLSCRSYLSDLLRTGPTNLFRVMLLLGVQSRGRWGEG